MFGSFVKLRNKEFEFGLAVSTLMHKTKTNIVISNKSNVWDCNVPKNKSGLE